MSDDLREMITRLSDRLEAMEKKIAGAERNLLLLLGGALMWLLSPYAEALRTLAGGQ